MWTDTAQSTQTREVPCCTWKSHLYSLSHCPASHTKGRCLLDVETFPLAKVHFLLTVLCPLWVTLWGQTLWLGFRRGKWRHMICQLGKVLVCWRGTAWALPPAQPTIDRSPWVSNPANTNLLSQKGCHCRYHHHLLQCIVKLGQFRAPWGQLWGFSDVGAPSLHLLHPGYKHLCVWDTYTPWHSKHISSPMIYQKCGYSHKFAWPVPVRAVDTKNGTF